MIHTMLPSGLTYIEQVPHGAFLGVVGLGRVAGRRANALVLELEQVLSFHLR